jgi:hypothetical protein
MAKSGTLLVPDEALSQLPVQLRKELLGAFREIVSNFTERRWEPAELNGGKLSECAYSICFGMCSGKMPPKASKPQNMPQACRELENKYPQALRSVRIQIPRMIIALYDIRNDRGVGHTGGEVNPNHMDALCVLQMSKWVVAELVRLLHHMPVDEAADLVEALVEREVPLVWKVGNKRRALDPKMSMPDKTLLLLHGCTGPVSEADLIDWTEHTKASLYRRDVLRRAHRAKLLEYDEQAKAVVISPTGVAHVEQKLIPSALSRH